MRLTLAHRLHAKPYWDTCHGFVKPVQLSQIGSTRISREVLLTDKIYFTSTLITAAGCESDTFRAWRNRNGLFPETAGSGKWNKFSVVDILVAGLVTDLTARGMSAQTAVDSAMKAAPLLANLYDVPLTERDFFFPNEMLQKIKNKIWPEKTLFPVLVVTVPFHYAKRRYSPVVEILSSHTAAGKIFGVSGWVATIVHLGSLCQAVLGSELARPTAVAEA